MYNVHYRVFNKYSVECIVIQIKCIYSLHFTAFNECMSSLSLQYSWFNVILLLVKH